MDPVTHTFVGASLSATGLRRATPLAAATLILAANAPDVDIAAQAWGPYTALAWRRGVTHGLPALLVLPFLVAGAILAWDRLLRRRRRPSLAPARPGAVLGLAFLGVWTHPFLDWLNTYGMRWLMPLDGSWSYGDAVFIIDPWLWLLLGGALFCVHSRTAAGRVAWALLAVVMSLLVLGTGAVPLWGQALWTAGVVGWVLIRFRQASGDGGPAGERVARAAVAAAALYILLMVLQTPLAERAVLAQAREMGVGPVDEVMVGPVPARPLQGEVILRTPEGYRQGSFSWAPVPRLVLDPALVAETTGSLAAIQAARSHPDVERYLTWARYPSFEASPDAEGWRVAIRDIRYMGREGTGPLGGITVRLGADLRPVVDGVQGTASPDTVLARMAFDSAWSRIAHTHFDPGLGGVDWDGVRRELRPRALRAETRAELRAVIREMLSRLGQSHFVLLPTGGEAPRTGEEALPAEVGDPGLDFRWVEGVPTVVRVPGDDAVHPSGLRPGWVLETVEAVPVEAMIEELRAGTPPQELDTVLATWLPLLLRERLVGPLGTPVELTFRDAAERSRTVRLDRAPPEGELISFGNLPPIRMEVSEEVRELEDGRQVGILHFSAWFPQVAARVDEAVDRFREMDALVVDLRGNPGGVGPLVMGVGGHFLAEPASLGTMRTREAELRFVTNPRTVAPDGRRVEPYGGPLAILVDPVSASTSEIFAGGLQALGRARIFGERTAGQALPAVMVELPGGDRLLHAVADFTGPDGTRLEGRGVHPDVLVPLTREALLRRYDPALEAALAWLAGLPGTTRPDEPTNPERTP